MTSPTKSGALFIRRNTQMRSLFLSYPRMDAKDEVLADLRNFHNLDLKVNLPVITADTTGIELRLPDFLSGIFYLKIKDGETSFTERLAIQ